MSQRTDILRWLEVAGPQGVHSFKLLSITPRYAARIHELKELGYEISSTPEKGDGDANGVRYKLHPAPSEPPTYKAGVASNETNAFATRRGGGATAGSRSVPSMFDLDSDWAA